MEVSQYLPQCLILPKYSVDVRGIKVSLNTVHYEPFIFALPVPYPLLSLSTKEIKSKVNVQNSKAGQSK